MRRGKLQIVTDIDIEDIDALDELNLEGMLYEVSWNERPAKITGTVTDEHGEIVREIE